MWVMLIYALAYNQMRIEKIEFGSQKLCEQALPKVNGLAVRGYPMNTTCIRVK